MKKFQLSIKTLLLITGAVGVFLFCQSLISANAKQLKVDFSTVETNCLALNGRRMLSIRDLRMEDRTTFLDRLLFRQRMAFEYDATFVGAESHFGGERTCFQCTCVSEFLVGVFSNRQLTHDQQVDAVFK